MPESGSEIIAQMPETIALIAFILGACMGSFITMASYRIPLGEDIVWKPSRCPSCEKSLGFWDLFPMLSWTFSGRKCRYCKTPVSVRYPLTELVSALTFLGLYLKFGFTLECAALMLIATMILILIVTDLEHYIIPDGVQIGLLLSIGWLIWIRDASIMDATYGALAGLATGLGLRYSFLWLRKIEALGWGDIKLLPIIGMAVGVKPFVLVLVLSGLLGILTGLVWKLLKRGPVFPFGPALAVSMFTVLVFWSELASGPYLKEFFS